MHTAEKGRVYDMESQHFESSTGRKHIKPHARQITVRLFAALLLFYLCSKYAGFIWTMI